MNLDPKEPQPQSAPPRTVQFMGRTWLVTVHPGPLDDEIVYMRRLGLPPTPPEEGALVPNPLPTAAGCLIATVAVLVLLAAAATAGWWIRTLFGA